ncbi:transcription elongation factor SPT5-like [Cryptomeria japonica]|uniref:transcription elongation factor SPT5-like n=1 Tax=Cryptomeria japonica TaxID=3369 RepID=UPI0027DA7CE1|nr:transcription elongation factor SPT5-like [Cryptomeria japonica]
MVELKKQVKEMEEELDRRRNLHHKRKKEDSKECHVCDIDEEEDEYEEIDEPEEERKKEEAKECNVFDTEYDEDDEYEEIDELDDESESYPEESVHGAVQDGVPQLDTQQYFSKMQQIMQNPQFMNMAERLCSALMQEVNTQQKLQDTYETEQEEPTINREETIIAQVPIVSATRLQEVEIPEDVREEVERFREMFTPLKIPLTYTGRQQVEDFETDSNEYEWDLVHLLDTSTTKTPEESTTTTDDT